MLVAPCRKHLTRTFGSNVGSGDLHDIRHAKVTQLANRPCAPILVREPPADELVVFSTRRVHKNRNSLCDAALHEVRRFERPGATGMLEGSMRSREAGAGELRCGTSLKPD